MSDTTAGTAADTRTNTTRDTTTDTSADTTADTTADTLEFDIDDLETEFFEQYMSPEGELEQDADTFEYEWPVTEWATKDAVRSIFEDRLSESEMDELAADLDLTSTSWLSVEEYNELEDDDGSLDDDLEEFGSGA